MTPPQTLREAFELYQRHKLRDSAESTRKHYLVSCGRFDKFLGRPALLVDLTDDNLADVMAEIIRRGGGARTANKFRDNIGAIWRFLARKGIVSQWPDVQPLNEPKRTPIAWSREQLAKLWQACESQPGFIGPVRASLWWHALHALAWDTGERVSAVIAIGRVDIDLDERWVNVRAELRKGKREDKLSRLNPHTVAVLRRIISEDSGRVFPWPYVKNYLWTRYTHLLKRAGLPHDRAHKFHCLRKSAASYFEAAGGNATQLLGHADARMTAKYLDPRICAQQQAADLLFRPNAAPAAPAVESIAKLIAAFASEIGGRCTARHTSRRLFCVRSILDEIHVEAVDQLSAEPITRCLDARAASGMAPITVSRYRESIRAFVEWIAARTKNPAANTCAAELLNRGGKAAAA
jgi:integrase